MEVGALISELKRRRVFRALVGYGIAAFAVLQIAEPIIHGLRWPEAALSYVVAALAAGFPIVVALAWIFDVGSGLERSSPAPPGHLGGKRIAVLLVAVGALAAAPGLVWYFVLRGRTTFMDRRSAAEIAPSIAVLPFADLSAQRDQEYFSEGVAEEILGALTQIDGLHVAGRTSSFSFKGTKEDLRTIGQRLGVTHVLEGSLRREGRRVRIVAQLVNANDGYQLWSRTFDRELTDVFAVQDEIAQAVVAALQLKLLPAKSSTAGEAPTVNPEAYDDYLLGMQFVRQGSGVGYRRAEEAFRKAVALDPSYALAHVGLSMSLWGRYGAGDAESRAATLQLEEDAMAAAERAVTLGPTLAETYRQRGAMRRGYQWDWAGARSDFERALSINPGSVESLRHLGSHLIMLRERPQGLGLLKRAAELDPLSADALRFLGWGYQDSGQASLARAAFMRAVHVAPEHDWALFFLSTSLLAEGDPANALATLESSRTEFWRLMARALAYHSLGRPAESKQALDRMIAGYAHIAAYQIAEAFAWRGERDSAMNWLERCYQDRDGGLVYATQDPLLRKARGDPRFAALLKKMNLPAD